ncbi:MAG: hypothetical protein ACT4P8_11455 [Betaproteobacteria bacterium]
MNFINATHLAYKTEAELFAMIRRAAESLDNMDAADPDRAATIASIRIMKQALAARRQMKGPKPF